MLAGAGSILALDNRFEDSNTNALGGLYKHLLIWWDFQGDPGWWVL